MLFLEIRPFKKSTKEKFDPFLEITEWIFIRIKRYAEQSSIILGIFIISH